LLKEDNIMNLKDLRNSNNFAAMRDINHPAGALP
jgi:hypothetical protein